jgi:hypothetical protein
MKKFIFLFLFSFTSFTSFAEDIPCKFLKVYDPFLPSVRLNPNSDWITIMPQYPALSPISPSYSKNCKFVSEAFSTISYSESSDDENVYYYTIFATHSSPSPIPSCSSGESPLFALIDKSNYLVEQHNGCVSDVNSWFGDVEAECYFYLQASVPHTFRYFFYCPIFDSSPALSVSQRTAVKTNELLSETDSKLGLIVGSSAANTGFLEQIKNIFFSLLTKKNAFLGVGNSYNEYEQLLSISNIDLTNLTKVDFLISSSSSSQCPIDVSFDLLGSTQKISFQPLCDFSMKFKPFVVAVSRVSAALLILGAL